MWPNSRQCAGSANHHRDGARVDGRVVCFCSVARAEKQTARSRCAGQAAGPGTRRQTSSAREQRQRRQGDNCAANIAQRPATHAQAPRADPSIRRIQSARIAESPLDELHRRRIRNAPLRRPQQRRRAISQIQTHKRRPRCAISGSVVQPKWGRLCRRIRQRPLDAGRQSAAATATAAASRRSVCLRAPRPRAAWHDGHERGDAGSAPDCSRCILLVVVLQGRCCCGGGGG